KRRRGRRDGGSSLEAAARRGAGGNARVIRIMIGSREPALDEPRPRLLFAPTPRTGSSASRAVTASSPVSKSERGGGGEGFDIPPTAAKVHAAGGCPPSYGESSPLAFSALQPLRHPGR